MRTHVRIGYDLMSRVAFLASAAEIVLTHHEFYDGTGYPQGLAGEEIPLGARVFTIADTMDAMMSDRPYRQGRSYAVARAEIEHESGRQFDPHSGCYVPGDPRRNLGRHPPGSNPDAVGAYTRIPKRSDPERKSPVRGW